ncbi:MAG: hypothetical protein Q9191_005480, partial [Dirinaria sp. TL-2023a]
MLASGFNREAVRRGSDRVKPILEKFIQKLNLYAQSGKRVNLTRGSMCLFADGLMSYAFQKPYGALDAEDFESELLVPVVDFASMMQWPVYFPRMMGYAFKATEILPDWMCRDQVNVLQSQEDLNSVFDTTLHPNVEKGQFTPPLNEMAADAFSFINAGTDTSSNALSIGIFELLDGPPHMIQRLKRELLESIPDENTMVEWAVLEKLPYLV